MAADTTSAGTAEPARSSAPDFDPAVFWRWLAVRAQPIAGWVMIAVGALVLTLGYLGVSREALVARQLPYVLSGGIGGISLVFLGGVWLGLTDIRRLNRRLDHVEQLAADLHRVLLTATDTQLDATGVAADDDTEQFAAPLVKLPTGQSYHLADCAVVAGKDTERLTPAAAAERGLTPCKLCEPASSSA